MTSMATCNDRKQGEVKEALLPVHLSPQGRIRELSNCLVASGDSCRLCLLCAGAGSREQTPESWLQVTGLTAIKQGPESSARSSTLWRQISRSAVELGLRVKLPRTTTSSLPPETKTLSAETRSCIVFFLSYCCQNPPLQAMSLCHGPARVSKLHSKSSPVFSGSYYILGPGTGIDPRIFSSPLKVRLQTQNPVYICLSSVTRLSTGV